MKKVFTYTLLSFLLLVSYGVMGQPKRPEKHNHPSGKQHALSLAANIPLGKFSSTHFMASAANYSWTNHRFGRMDVKPVKPVGIIANSGAAWYFGKTETVGGYPYRYPRYIFIHAMAGAVYNPWRRGNISLTVGPAFGNYLGKTKFNLCSKLEGAYYFHERIAISPALIFMKESGVDPLWSVGFGATWAL